MRKLLAGGALALLLTTTAQAEEPFVSHLPYMQDQDTGPYLSEQLPKPAYRQALANVVDGAERPVPR
jgi:hypothetical protein